MIVALQDECAFERRMEDGAVMLAATIPSCSGKPQPKLNRLRLLLSECSFDYKRTPDGLEADVTNECLVAVWRPCALNCQAVWIS